MIFVKVAGKIFWISSQSLWATGSHIRIQFCNNQTLVLGERKKKTQRLTREKPLLRAEENLRRKFNSHNHVIRVVEGE